VLGVNPVQHLLAATGALHSLPATAQRTLTGPAFFHDLISAPFHHGLTVVFAVATPLAAVAAVASLLRGARQSHLDEAWRSSPLTIRPKISYYGSSSMTRRRCGRAVDAGRN
jgi:hypothetical protein